MSAFRERRVHARRRLEPLAYVNIGASRAVVSNISEGGLGVIAASPQIESHISSLAFHLPGSRDQVEARGQIAWISKSKTEAGIRFVDPSETARRRIKEWISLESTLATFQSETVIRPQLPEPPQSYQIRKVRLDTDQMWVIKSWTEFHRKFPGHTLNGDPEWLEQRFQHEKEKVHAFLLEKGNQVCGAVPFVLNGEQLTCELGEFALAKFPMRVLRLQGYAPDISDEEAAYDRLFGQILQTDFEAIYMENVKTESFLWNYLQSNSLMRRRFRFYTKRGPLPHSLVRLEGTFESYMKKFSSKARKNRLREIRTLHKRGPVNLLRVTAASEIDAFLETAYEISRRTWQLKHFGGGLAARDPAVVRRELRFLAEHGLLRSYVLECDGAPCS
jgi:hypothetical protein